MLTVGCNETCLAGGRDLVLVQIGLPDRLKWRFNLVTGDEQAERSGGGVRRSAF